MIILTRSKSTFYPTNLVEIAPNFTIFELFTDIISHNSLTIKDMKDLNISEETRGYQLSNSIIRFKIAL